MQVQCEGYSGLLGEFEPPSEKSEVEEPNILVDPISTHGVLKLELLNVGGQQGFVIRNLKLFFVVGPIPFCTIWSHGIPPKWQYAHRI